MTKDEALALALEALEQLDGIDTETECITIDIADVIAAIKQAEQPHVDSAAELSIGESSFEGWYSNYERQGVSKQVARDAYAAGMGDPLVQPKAQQDHIADASKMVSTGHYKMVPVEPTLKMLSALGFGGDEGMLIGHANVHREMVDGYRAMLAAAPTPPAPGET